MRQAKGSAMRKTREQRAMMQKPSRKQINASLGAQAPIDMALDKIAEIQHRKSRAQMKEDYAPIGDFASPKQGD